MEMKEDFDVFSPRSRSSVSDGDEGVERRSLDFEETLDFFGENNLNLAPFVSIGRRTTF